MKNVIDDIVRGIEEAPSTFYNLALTGNPFAQVIGPTALDDTNATPRYGFSDQVIRAAELREHPLMNNPHVHLCGSFFSVSQEEGDGIRALPLMMRLARAGIIFPANYSEGLDLDAWSATREAGAEMRALLQESGLAPSQVKSRVRNLLAHDSPSKAGKSLYDRIVQNYR